MNFCKLWIVHTAAFFVSLIAVAVGVSLVEYAMQTQSPPTLVCLLISSALCALPATLISMRNRKAW
jgi:hypothetical protein